MLVSELKKYMGNERPPEAVIFRRIIDWRVPKRFEEHTGVSVRGTVPSDVATIGAADVRTGLRGSARYSTPGGGIQEEVASGHEVAIIQATNVEGNGVRHAHIKPTRWGKVKAFLYSLGASYTETSVSSRVGPERPETNATVTRDVRDKKGRIREHTWSWEGDSQSNNGSGKSVQSSRAGSLRDQVPSGAKVTEIKESSDGRVEIKWSRGRFDQGSITQFPGK